MQACSQSLTFWSCQIEGADPDNVAQQETAGELHPLSTQELPAAKPHEGKVSELLTSRESVELSNVVLNKTQVRHSVYFESDAYRHDRQRFVDIHFHEFVCEENVILSLCLALALPDIWSCGDPLQ